MRTRLAIIAAVAAFAVPAFAQDDEQDGAWRVQLDKLVHDRFADVEGDRIDKALGIVQARVKASPEDAAARLELARLALVKDDFDQAQLEAGKATAGKGDVVKQAEALRMLATYFGGRSKLEKADESEREKLGQDFEARMKAAHEKLQAAAGSKEAADKLLQQEHGRFMDLKSLGQVGKAPLAIGKNDVDGKPIELADYKGKVLLIDFWATWCGPCMGELPNVLEVYKKYHDRGLEILGVSLDQKREAFDKITKDRGMTWRHYFDGKGWQNEVAAAWGIHSIPATFLIDHEGKIRWVNARGEGLGAAVKVLIERAEAAAKNKKS